MGSFLYTGKPYTREENFMVTKTQMQQIQDLKLIGYTKRITSAIMKHAAKSCHPTISKYYDMDVIPEDRGTKLAKPKTFDAEHFRSTILLILEKKRERFCMSSVYDVLEEKFIENGSYDKLVKVRPFIACPILFSQ